MQKTNGAPVLIASSGTTARIERIMLGAGIHDEAWLQELIFAHPELLPISQIEPGFGVPVPAAREIACGHGYIDNLYLTPTGEIILVETKLWRNGQARREVVAQALDYVSALMRMGYEQFEAAIVKASGGAHERLYDIVAKADALDEAAFFDAVSRNLLRGRMLVIALGDGIRQEAETLASLLQSHAGAHFTFALIELTTWREADSGNILAIPNTLAQTVMIERGILTFADGVPLIKPASVQVDKKAYSLTEEMFYEELAKTDPGLPTAIRDFLKLVEPLHVYPDLKASLNIKVVLPEAARPFNLGAIAKDGKFWTDAFSWTASEAQAVWYNQRLADLIGGKVAIKKNIYLTTSQGSIPTIDLLLPQHAHAWADAIGLLVSDLRKEAVVE